jgi:hypothetical protein
LLATFLSRPRPSFLSLASLLLLALAIPAPRAVAQVSASIQGRVTDASGAAIPNASITLQNLNTSATRTAISTRNGQYQILSLPAGDYRLTARKSGFAQEIRTGIRLAVGQSATANLTLRIGSVRQQFTVHADASPLSLTTSDISGLVNQRQLRSLPLNGRSYDQLMTLDPGIVNYTSQKTGGIGVSNSTVGNNFAVSGNRPQQNLYLLNGIEFTGAAEVNMQPGGTSQQLLGVDAVREFNVLRDNYGAQYGKRSGAQVLIVTRSGTNQFHGSVYEFLRNNVLDAPNYFDRGATPPFQRNQYGAALGGPLQRNKTFLFGNYESFRQHLHQTGVDLVPDANARNGLLPCKLVSPTPSPCPSSGLVNVGIAPGVASLLNLWPTPSPGAPDFGGISEAFNSPLQIIHEDFGTARLDHIFSSRDAISAVYTVDASSDVTPTSTNAYSTDLENLTEHVASLEETHIFSPSLLNVARIGYSRAYYYYTGEPTPGTPAASVPSFVANHAVGAVVVGGSAAANPTAQISLAGSNVGTNLHIARNLYTVEDHLTLTRGRHSITVGIWLQPLQANEDLALLQSGQATFSGLQQFLEGKAGSFNYDPTPTEMNWRMLMGAWYAQDLIRLTPHLTASLGFRDGFTNGWNEAHNRAANFVFENGVIQTQPRVAHSAFTVNNAKFLPQPRIGLAWQPIAHTVLHAGFGTYYDMQDALGYRLDQNAPFNPNYHLANLPVTSFPLASSPPAGATVEPAGVQPDMKTPTLISWTLRIDHQFTPNTWLSVGYIGSHGYHQMVSLDDNEPTPTICPAACPATYPGNFPAPLAGTAVPNGVYYIPAGTPRANPNLGPAWAWFSVGSSSYNALQFDFHHRLSHGLLMRGVYTWSKALDDGDSLNATASGNAPGLVSNPFHLRADWGPATYDVRNVATVDALYQLPFGRGGQYFAHLHGLANLLISGWTATSIVTLQSGFPFTPELSYNPSNNGDTKNPVRPFLNPAFHGKVITGKPSQWFNPAAFLAPPPNSGFYGNLGRDSLIGPGLATWDFSTLKDTTLHGSLRLQLRAEIFNLLNHANFNTPNLVVFAPSGLSPTAGVITSTSTTARQVQFGVRLFW